MRRRGLGSCSRRSLDAARRRLSKQFLEHILVEIQKHEMLRTQERDAIEFVSERDIEKIKTLHRTDKQQMAGADATKHTNKQRTLGADAQARTNGSTV